MDFRFVVRALRSRANIYVPVHTRRSRLFGGARRDILIVRFIAFSMTADARGANAEWPTSASSRPSGQCHYTVLLIVIFRYLSLNDTDPQSSTTHRWFWIVYDCHRPLMYICMFSLRPVVILVFCNLNRAYYSTSCVPGVLLKFGNSRWPI